MNWQPVCSEVTRLTKEVGGFILSERIRFNQELVEKKGHNDLVSYVDKESEQKLVKGLSALLPGAGFLTEEGTSAETGERYRWIIDPLDGTTNFIHGVPLYCISIALFDGYEPVLGVVHELNLDECFSAWKDGGAYLNGRPIHVSSTPDLASSLLATGFPYHDYDRMDSYMGVFDHCMRHTRGLRRLGSAAADLAYVAAGRFDGFFEYGLNPWDVAAGVVLVNEAGGKTCDFKGGPDATFGKEIIACNAAVYEEFLGVIEANFSKRPINGLSPD
jgi:myo-inositol-1(or 4)-monophosphatase